MKIKPGLCCELCSHAQPTPSTAIRTYRQCNLHKVRVSRLSYCEGFSANTTLYKKLKTSDFDVELKKWATARNDASATHRATLRTQFLTANPKPSTTGDASADSKSWSEWHAKQKKFLTDEMKAFRSSYDQKHPKPQDASAEATEIDSRLSELEL
jgi:hypothetical protein